MALVTSLVLGGTGCLSHEYKVSQAELARLAGAPPAVRGARLRAVQKLGMRRAPAIDTAPGAGSWPPPETPSYGPESGYGDYDDSHVHVGVHADILFPSGGHGRGGYPRYASGPVKAPPAGAGGARPIGQPVVAPPASGSWRGGGRPPPASNGSAFGGGGGGLSVPSGGGGGKEDAIVFAVVAVAVASLAAVGLAVTEGLRFDGDVAAAPGQLLYLRGPSGEERPVPLGALGGADLAGVTGAVIRDDEGYGLYQLQRAPLDRQGFSFKVDVGGTTATLDRDLVSGLASHIQLGYFPHQRVGILGGLALSVGQGGTEQRFARHALALEAQVFPLSWWRLHLGGAAHVGSGLLRHQGSAIDGALTVGAGAIFEVALTTRLALHARLDWSGARTAPQEWSRARSLSAGLAIY